MEKREIIPAAITAALEARFYPDYSITPTVVPGQKAVAVILTDKTGTCVVVAHNNDTHYGAWRVTKPLHASQAQTTAERYAQEGLK